MVWGWHEGKSAGAPSRPPGGGIHPACPPQPAGSGNRGFIRFDLNFPVPEGEPDLAAMLAELSHGKRRWTICSATSRRPGS